MTAMKLAILVVCCLALSEALKTHKKHDTLKAHHKAHLHEHLAGEGDVDDLIEKAGPDFDKHKAEHKLDWNEDEESDRFVNYAKVHHSVSKHNSEHTKHGYKLAVNHLAHWHENELHAMLGHKDQTPRPDDESNDEGRSKRGDPPAEMDWRTKGAVTDVKNQGNCGSCWAFSATGALEGAHFLKTGKLVSLSEENLVSCTMGLLSYSNHACAGGSPVSAFDYAKDNSGLSTEADYPYMEAKTNAAGQVAPCRAQPVTRVARVGTPTANSKWVTPRNDESALKAAVGTIGPISIAISVMDPTFFAYKSGIYSNPTCTGTANHAVLAVGYGTENGKDFWIVKNSWSTQWGENGYMRIARNAGNMCVVASSASYPLVAD